MSRRVGSYSGWATLKTGGDVIGVWAELDASQDVLALGYDGSEIGGLIEWAGRLEYWGRIRVPFGEEIEVVLPGAATGAKALVTHAYPDVMHIEGTGTPPFDTTDPSR